MIDFLGRRDKRRKKQRSNFCFKKRIVSHSIEQPCKSGKTSGGDRWIIKFSAIGKYWSRQNDVDYHTPKNHQVIQSVKIWRFKYRQLQTILRLIWFEFCWALNVKSGGKDYFSPFLFSQTLKNFSPAYCFFTEAQSMKLCWQLPLCLLL